MKVLGIFAHPDDETILIGGTLAMLTSYGAELHLLSATRGEGGELGEPPITDRESLGKAREEELRCALESLGGASVKFLDYEDPTIEDGQEGLGFTDDLDGLTAEITPHLVRLEPQVVLSHGSNGEYGHPAHILLHKAVYLAALDLGISMYGVSASFNRHPRPRLANQDDPATVVLNITSWLDQKLAAASCHRTQHALFVRRSSVQAGRALEISEVLMRTESLHRFIPANHRSSSDPLGSFMHARCGSELLYLDMHPGLGRR